MLRLKNTGKEQFGAVGWKEATTKEFNTSDLTISHLYKNVRM